MSEWILNCPLCKEVVNGEVEIAFHYWMCDKACLLRDEWRARDAIERKKLLKGFKL